MANPSLLDQETRESALRLTEWCKRPCQEKRGERSKGVGGSSWNRALDDAREAMVDGDWSGAKPLTFVALYALLHERIYGVAPAELTAEQRLYAAGAAARLLKVEFGGEPGEMAEFLRWTWRKEKETEAWRRAHKRDGRRIGWRLQFGGSLLTDFRVSRDRTRGR